jgi:hypothetical protein
MGSSSFILSRFEKAQRGGAGYRLCAGKKVVHLVPADGFCFRPRRKPAFFLCTISFPTLTHTSPMVCRPPRVCPSARQVLKNPYFLRMFGIEHNYNNPRRKVKQFVKKTEPVKDKGSVFLIYLLSIGRYSLRSMTDL